LTRELTFKSVIKHASQPLISTSILSPKTPSRLAAAFVMPILMRGFFLDAGMQETRVVDAGWRRVDTIYSEGQQSEGEQTESRRSLQQRSGCLLNSRHEYFSARLLCEGEEMYRRWTGHEQI
jgi:hypothetical protein